MVIEHLSDVCMADCYNLLLPLLGCLHEQHMTETEVSAVTLLTIMLATTDLMTFKFYWYKSSIRAHIFSVTLFYQKKLPLNQIPCCKPFFSRQDYNLFKQSVTANAKG